MWLVCGSGAKTRDASLAWKKIGGVGKQSSRRIGGGGGVGRGCWKGTKLKEKGGKKGGKWMKKKNAKHCGR